MIVVPSIPAEVRPRRGGLLRLTPPVSLGEWAALPEAGRSWLHARYHHLSTAMRLPWLIIIQVTPSGRDVFDALNARDELAGWRIELPNGRLFTYTADLGPVRRRKGWWLADGVHVHSTDDFAPAHPCNIPGARRYWHGSVECRDRLPQWLQKPEPTSSSRACLTAFGNTLDARNRAQGTSTQKKCANPLTVEEALKRFGPRARRMALAYGWEFGSQIVDDLEQLARIKIALNVPEHIPRNETRWLNSYMRPLLRRAIIDGLRRESRRAGLHAPLDDTDWAYIDTTSDDPLARIIAREALFQTSHPEVLLLRQHGYELKEIALMLERPLERVKKQSQRSHKQFWSYLVDEVEPYRAVVRVQRGGGPIDE